MAITEHPVKQSPENVFAWPAGVVVTGTPRTKTFTGISLERVSMSPRFSLTPGTAGDTGSQICVGPDGNLWLLGTLAEEEPQTKHEITYGAIYEVTPTAVILRFKYPAIWDQPYAPGEMVTGPDGALWIADWGREAIERYAPSSGSFKVYPVGPGVPISIAVGPEQALWFTSSSGRIGRMTLAGEATERVIEDGDTQGPWGFMQPYSIALGPDGALWFTEQIGRIGRMTPAWQLQEFTVPNARGLPAYDGGPSPRYIVTGPDGAMWFTDPGDNSIGRVTMGGEVSEYSIPSGSSSASRAAREVVPDHIASGPEGLLWFTEENAKQLGSIDPNASPAPTARSIAKPAGRRAGRCASLRAADRARRMRTGARRPCEHAAKHRVSHRKRT